MQKCVKLTILLFLASFAAAQTTPTRIRTVTTLPATCQPGDGIRPADQVALVASGFSTPYLCGATNMWFTPTQFSGIGTVPYYPANGITTKGDPNFIDDGAGNVQLSSAKFVGSGSAGFAGFGAGTIPSLTATNTAYWYAATSIANSFGTMLPATPGTPGQGLIIDTAPDGTHITTKWGAVSGSPGGSNTQVQVNNGGVFGAISSSTAGKALISNGAGVLPSFQAITASTAGLGTVVTANGLVCDGVTDDTAAMRTLLTSIGSSPTRLIFPTGKCLLQNMTFPANVTLDFASGGSILALTSSTPPGGAGFVQGSGTSNNLSSPTTSCSVTLTGTTAGNTILFLSQIYFTGGGHTMTTPSDGVNAYAPVFSTSYGLSEQNLAWVSSGIAGGTVTITSPVTAGASRNSCIAWEISGMGPLVVADGVGAFATPGSSTTTMTSGSATTTAGSLVIGFGGQNDVTAGLDATCTVGAGYTQPAGAAGQVDTKQAFCAEYALSSAGGATSASQTLSATVYDPGTFQYWVYSIFALKPGSAVIQIKGGIIDPDLHQIFFNATGTGGSIDFTGNMADFAVQPEWWGASSGATAAVNTPALQAAEHGAFGINRTNSSGLSQYNKELNLSGNYQINDELQFYHVLNFRVKCDGRLLSGITQTAVNKRIIDGQSIAYGRFDDCAWANSAASTNAQIDLDYDGTHGNDLRPQFIDFNRNTFSGGGVTDAGVLIAKSGGGAQGSNIYCHNCAASGYTGAAWQIGGNNTGRNVGRFYALNAVSNAWLGGDIQSSPQYGIAVYGGQMAVGGSDLTTFEDGIGTQTGFDVFCEAPQAPCSMDNIRSEGLQVASGVSNISRTFNVNQAFIWRDFNLGTSLPGATSFVGELITGTAYGGDGSYYKVTNVGTFGGAPLQTATSGGATTIANTGATWTVNGFVGQQATILLGTGNGQFCVITSNTATVITCSGGWTSNYNYWQYAQGIVNPDNTSQFVVEPNWGTNGAQTASGSVTFAQFNFNVIQGGVTGSPTIVNGTFRDDSFIGGYVWAGGYLQNIIVSRPDWTKPFLTGQPLDTDLNFNQYCNISVFQPGNQYPRAWSFKRNNAPVNNYTDNTQCNQGVIPMVWSTGQHGGGVAALDTWIGGRHDPSSGSSVSRAVLEFGGTLGRATPVGINQNGTDTDIQGGLPTGAGTPGSVNILTGNAGGSGTTVADGTKRWQFTGAGHLFAFADNAYDIGAAGTNRPRNVFIAGNLTLGGTCAGCSSSAAVILFGNCSGASASSGNGVGVNGLGGSVGVGACTQSAQQKWGTLISHACIVKNLFVRSSVAGSNGSDGVMTVQQNAGATAITCTIGTGTTCNDTTHSFSASAGDQIWIKGSTTSTNLSDISVSMDCQ